MRRRMGLSFDVLESKVVLSPTNPFEPPAEADDSLVIEAERQMLLQMEREIEAAEKQLFEAIGDSIIRDAIEAERKASQEAINEALKPWPEPAPDPGYWESFINAVDEAIKAATESQIPLFHP